MEEYIATIKEMINDYLRRNHQRTIEQKMTEKKIVDQPNVLNAYYKLVLQQMIYEYTNGNITKELPQEKQILGVITKEEWGYVDDLVKSYLDYKEELKNKVA